MGLCQYRDIFGKPGEGVHSYRLFGIAIVDLGLTILVSLIIAYLLGKNPLVICVIALLLGIIFHYLFCVNTTVNKAIFGVIGVITPITPITPSAVSTT